MNTMKSKNLVFWLSVGVVLGLVVAKWNGLAPVTSAAGVHSEAAIDDSAVPSVANALAQLPFIANTGQYPAEVEFVARTFAGTVFITDAGELVYSLDAGQGNGWSVVERLQTRTLLKPTELEPSPVGITRHVGRGNSSEAASALGSSAVSLGEAWPGIEVSVHARVNNIEKLFTLNPGADPKVIRMNIAGATSIHQNESGLLVVGTDLGEVAYSAPLAWQVIGGKKKYIDVAYAVDADTYGFQVGDYDPGRTLVIDPVIQSTFLGGSGSEFGLSGVDNAMGMVVHPSNGDIYVAGMTTSSEFPGTAGGYSSTKNAARDMYIARMSEDLTQLKQATYFGGTVNASGEGHKGEPLYDIDIHPLTGDVYVVGTSENVDVPTTPGAYQPNLSGTNRTDLVVARFSPDLRSLGGATYFGGTGGENTNLNARLVFDASTGDPIVIGTGYSSDLPGTAGGAQEAAYQCDRRGVSEVFLARFSQDLGQLVQATYMCSAGHTMFDAEVHPLNRDIYIAGRPNGGGFRVSRINPSLTSQPHAQWTFKTGLWDEAHALDFTSNGDVVVAGQTRNLSFPGVAGGYDDSYAGPTLIGNHGIGVISRFDENLNLLQSTYLHAHENGTEEERQGGNILDILVHPASDEIYVSGYSGSPGTHMPNSEGAIQENHGGGSTTAYLSRLSGDLTQLFQSTHFGGTSTRIFLLRAEPGTTNFYAAGFPGAVQYDNAISATAEGGIQPTSNGGDVFVSKLGKSLAAQPDMDFGDAPDPSYPTLLASDGARHVMTALVLGTQIDDEADASPGSMATGDDNDNALNDEDGVLLGDLRAGTTSTIQVLVSGGTGQLDAWMDFNRDGDWQDDGERIFSGFVLAEGSHELAVTVPSDSVPGESFGRFRLSSDGISDPGGLAIDGEVEDYRILILERDSDNDGYVDSMDNCVQTANPDQLDLDGDGQGDLCDDDVDGDSQPNATDNCPLAANPDQLDLDADGTGDACDPDDDGDGKNDDADNCPLAVNAKQDDLDQDGIGDVCDDDVDGDGVANGTDNCPVVSNEDQLDSNADGVGDACTSSQDDDNDGVLNDIDQCPNTAAGQPVDPANGCAIAQICPCSDPWRNHGQYVSCVSHAADDFYSRSIIDQALKDAVVSEAAQSSCGKKKR